MPLMKKAPESWPALAGWLSVQNSTDLQRAIVYRAMQDVGILEVPLGSNRGTRIDRYTKRAGSPLGSWWCAIFIGAVLADCGVMIPEGYPSTDAWIPFLTDTPTIGSAIVYGLTKNGKKDAHHIGLVVRLEPMILTIEGNRSFAGTASNNGVAVDIGPLNRRDILGYYAPRTK